MNSFYKIFVTITAVNMLLACSPSETKTPESIYISPVNENAFVLDRLLGTWKSEDGKTFERWSKGRDNYHSFVYTLNGTDTLVNEQAIVFKESGKWIFETTVNGQNQGKSVRFTASVVKDNVIQFSNPQHDFPTDINYTLSDSETVSAFIAGPNSKGGKDTIPFNFKRMK